MSHVAGVLHNIKYLTDKNAREAKLDDDGDLLLASQVCGREKFFYRGKQKREKSPRRFKRSIARPHPL